MARRTAIVVPCFDEASRLDAAAFLAFDDPDVRFVFVDDGSRDATVQRIGELVSADPERFELVVREVNGGKAAAVRDGVRHALARPDTEHVGYWDADLATPLPVIAELRALLERDPAVQIALGSRVKILGRNIERRALRHYFGRVAAMAASNLLGMDVYDTQCGAKLFRRTPHVDALFAEPFSTRWAFDVEILARWLGRHPHVPRPEMGRYVVEHPLHTWLDVRGSKVRLADLLQGPAELARIWLRYRRHLRRLPPVP